MSDSKRISKMAKVFCLIGSILLLVMGIFHGSGFFYIQEAIEKSNAESFLKEIVPVLFAHPSIHLISLSALGILAIFLKQDLRKLTWLLAVLILSDAILGFYLGGVIPGFLLLAAAICFVIAGLKDKTIIPV